MSSELVNLRCKEVVSPILIDVKNAEEKIFKKFKKRYNVCKIKTFNIAMRR